MENSMNFFVDSIFTDFDRSDFIGGIDNEALDFGALDQYMATNTTVSLDGALAVCNSNELNVSQSKINSPAITNESTKHIPIATLSARMTAATSVPTNNVINNGTNSHTHLPESPPDSGSEPPYSPLQDVHGLTLTSRDLYAGMTSDQHQYTSPHQQNLHYTNLMPQHSSTETLTAHNSESHHHNNNNNNIRIKHETNTILQSPLAEQQPLHNENHINVMENFQGSCNGLTSFENLQNSLYTSIHYSNLIANPEQAERPCLLTTSCTDGSRVQIIGTSQANNVARISAPSTPVGLASRKRKMSTQIDCNEFTVVKNDSGTLMSPTSLNHCKSMQLESVTSPALSSMNIENSLDGANSTTGQSSNGDTAEGNNNTLSPCIRFSAFQPHNWHKLVDQNLQELSPIFYRVDADKGFNFSTSDDAFVCQKKNHFQITCQARLQGEAKFVKTAAGLEKIKSFHLHFYGVKVETPNQTIRVEQSQSDRSKKPFFPVPIEIQSHVVSKITVGRLHFSETTNNNMRKKGRPNPEQRYFQLVVGLHAHTVSGNFPVISQGSERIIVRASNPGQFESDVDLCWQRGVTQDSICHTGRVGINTDRPDESLVVHGNLKVSGHIVQPSDSRAKHEIGELDTSVQLRNLLKIRIVKYRYERDFAIHSGLKRASESDTEEIIDTGVIAQEVREVIPDAVKEAGSIVLPNGSVIENFLLVNKDRILMENIGAVKELCKVTGTLANRIEHLERMNDRLVGAKKGHFEHKRKSTLFAINDSNADPGYEVCSNRSVQIIIFLLVIVMAACLAAVSTLYFMEHKKQVQNYKHLENVHAFTNDAEQWLQLHDILRRNKSFSHWPNLSHARTTSQTHVQRNKTHSTTHDAFTYNENNDEDNTASLEKPLYHSLKEQSYKISTSAPNQNKTLHKNKSKWPLPQEILRIAAVASQLQQQAHVTPANLGKKFSTAAHELELEDSLNSSKSSSEKGAADSIPIAQDFENNSIDVDAQQLVTKKTTGGKTSAPSTGQVAFLNDAVLAQETSLEQNESDKPLSESNVASTSISNFHTGLDDTTSATDRRNNADVVIYSVYKAVSPPTSSLALTTNKLVSETVQSNLSLEVPIRSNKSHDRIDSSPDHPDVLDLQNLSSNNDSVDNPITALFGFEYKGARESNLGRRSTTQHNTTASILISRVIRIQEIAYCTSSGATCASACYDDHNELNLSSPEILDKVEKTDIDADSVDADDEDANDSILLTTNHTSSTVHKSDSLNKQYIIDHQQAVLETDINEKQHEHTDEQHYIEESEPEITVESLSNCFSINNQFISKVLNKKLGEPEHFCPDSHTSLNLTYVIPISQFYRLSNIEFQISSLNPLEWILCNEIESFPSKHLPIHVSLAHNNSNNITSILVTNLPARGAFNYDIKLRASYNVTKFEEICLENAHKLNTILQYNYSILRNCD